MNKKGIYISESSLTLTGSLEHLLVLLDCVVCESEGLEKGLYYVGFENEAVPDDGYEHQVEKGLYWDG